MFIREESFQNNKQQITYLQIVSSRKAASHKNGTKNINFIISESDKKTAARRRIYAILTACNICSLYLTLKFRVDCCVAPKGHSPFIMDIFVLFLRFYIFSFLILFMRKYFFPNLKMNFYFVLSLYI
jgi:hypothetical protein